MAGIVRASDGGLRLPDKAESR